MATAAAPKTDSVDSVDFNNEDYNIRSMERTQLLTKIKEVIRGADVSPAFWACCQLADVSRLQTIAQADPDLILGYDDSVALLPLQWSQRFQDSGSQAASQCPGGAKTRKLNADGQLWVQRSAQEADNCEERDGYKCVLTKQSFPQAAHIFPYSMLNSLPKKDQTQTSRLNPGFWKLLRLFWDKDRITKWKETIFPDSQNPNTGVDRCFNLISLDAGVHVKWTKGLFALKPLGLSSDRKQLIVQFFWQVPGNYDMESQVDLLTEPTSSKGLDDVGDDYLSRKQDDGSTPCIRSGEVFTLTTKDPEKLPLPSVELLEMQWVLQRVVGMSGAAGWPTLDWDESVDDEDGWLISDHASNVEDTLKRVCDWVAAGKPAESLHSP